METESPRREPGAVRTVKEPGFLAPPLGELSCDSMTERAFLIFAKQISAFRGFSLKIPNPLRPGCAGPPLPKGEARAFLTRSRTTPFGVVLFLPVFRVSPGRFVGILFHGEFFLFVRIWQERHGFRLFGKIWKAGIHRFWNVVMLYRYECIFWANFV